MLAPGAAEWPAWCVSLYSCPHAARVNAGGTLLMWRKDACACVCIGSVSECCPTMELANSDERQFLPSFPAPPPASPWKTDRQADRQLSSQLVKLCLPGLPLRARRCVPGKCGAAPPHLPQPGCLAGTPPPRSVWISVLSFLRDRAPGGPFAIETWVLHRPVWS